MKYIKQTIVAGCTILRSVYPSTGTRKPGQKRTQRVNRSPESVRKTNLRNAILKLTAILNANFQNGDYHITLTHEDDPTPEEAKERLTRFLERMRGRSKAKRKGFDWKWVATTEHVNKRPHSHVVCSRVDRKIIEACWTWGHVSFVPLDTDGQYSGLADYFCKETEKTFRDPDAVQRQRFTHSRNLIIPEPRNKQITKAEYLEEIRCPSEEPGYKIDEDTVERYEHLLTEEECMFCIMKSGDPIERYTKGRKAEYEPFYKSTFEENREVTNEREV